MDCPVDPLKIMHGSRRNPSDRWLPSGDFYRYARATALRKPLRPKDGAGAAKPRLRANPPALRSPRVGVAQKPRHRCAGARRLELGGDIHEATPHPPFLPFAFQTIAHSSEERRVGKE